MSNVGDVDPTKFVLVERKSIQDQTKRFLAAFVLTFILAMSCISGLLYALTKANDTILKLSRDTKCRAQASSDESSALNELVIVLATDRENKVLISAAVKGLEEAHAARQKVATEGCAAP